MQLSKTEEQLMEYLWKKEKAFIKDLLEAYPEPKPATTTIATLLKRMSDKGFVAYKEYGKSREYYPLVKKTDYFHLSNPKLQPSPSMNLGAGQLHQEHLF